jgi:hypothetical protein
MSWELRERGSTAPIFPLTFRTKVDKDKKTTICAPANTVAMDPKTDSHRKEEEGHLEKSCLLLSYVSVCKMSRNIHGKLGGDLVIFTTSNPTLKPEGLLQTKSEMGGLPLPWLRVPFSLCLLELNAH